MKSHNRIGRNYGAIRRAEPYSVERRAIMTAKKAGGVYLDAARGTGNYKIASAETAGGERNAQKTLYERSETKEKSLCRKRM